ncbi:hypothetical protein C2845_PM02G19990 [Panicum miliaceum]|uniref:Uncharacterized protein n=1 Tax=Panicum miliaceum TaxID=4540 RepID=A0A3L6S8W5_PANMI|nr:hypothetical protein C2845_PM02G19990 [Panicum miliaceum]
MARLTPSVPASGRLRGNVQKSIWPPDQSPATRGGSGASFATSDHTDGHDLRSPDEGRPTERRLTSRQSQGFPSSQLLRPSRNRQCFQSLVNCSSHDEQKFPRNDDDSLWRSVPAQTGSGATLRGKRLPRLWRAERRPRLRRDPSQLPTRDRTAHATVAQSSPIRR